MNFERSIGMGILSYIAIFILSWITIYLSGVDMLSDQVPIFILYLNILIMIVLTILFTVWYFKDEKIKKGWIEGFYFGIVLILSNFILNFAALSISNGIQEVSVDILAFFINPVYLITLAIVLVTSAIVGEVMKKYSFNKKKKK